MNERLNATLASTLWPSRAPSRLARAATLAIAGTLVLAASAKAQVPFYPVPMTLQTLAVLTIGAAYGARLAAATLALYLAEGFVGLPVFAGALAGPGYMAGPTAGYLAGFVAAAALIGWLAESGWDRAWPRLIGAMAIGHALIFAFGFAWLALALGAEKAWAAGVAPFYAATLVKTLLAAALVRAARGGLALPRGSDA
ncbi:MAG: biotin transporter BioY [Roseiarcus sp.]|jgi:biotin transport system substrate-specific component